RAKEYCGRCTLAQSACQRTWASSCASAGEPGFFPRETRIPASTQVRESIAKALPHLQEVAGRLATPLIRPEPSGWTYRAKTNPSTRHPRQPHRTGRQSRNCCRRIPSVFTQVLEIDRKPDLAAKLSQFFICMCRCDRFQA